MSICVGDYMEVRDQSLMSFFQIYPPCLFIYLSFIFNDVCHYSPTRLDWSVSPKDLCVSAHSVGIIRAQHHPWLFT